MAASNDQEYYSQGLRKRFQLDALRVQQPLEDSTKYADINYAIDEAKYKERSERVVAAGGLPDSVPAGFPTSVSGPLVWTGTDFKDDTEYVLPLSSDDVEEIKSALQQFKESGLDRSDIKPANFVLQNLGPRLSKASDDIYSGRGFIIIRGLDPDQFSDDDYCTVYLGVSSYIAETRGMQDQQGTMLIHVVADDTTDEDQENPDKPFHTDVVCDVLALITKNVSAKGGKSVLASSWKVYNELAATRPDILHVLSAPDWPFDTYGRTPPYYERACLYYYEGKVILSFSRRLLVGHMPYEARSKGIPGLSEAQAEALDAVHFLAEKNAIHTSMQKGDMRFINNMGILHRREAFVNDAAHQRHLIRLWLHNKEKCWPLPEALKLAWARVFDDDDGGRPKYYNPTPERDVHGKVLQRERSCD